MWFVGKLYKVYRLNGLVASKITPVDKSVKIAGKPKCPHCGSTEFMCLPGQGVVAGKIDRKCVCLKCGKTLDL